MELLVGLLALLGNLAVNSVEVTPTATTVEVSASPTPAGQQIAALAVALLAILGNAQVTSVDVEANQFPTITLVAPN